MSNGEMPVFTVTSDNGIKYIKDLTKREYFAAMAMQGIISTISGTPYYISEQDEKISKYAVRLADTLLEELKK